MIHERRAGRSFAGNHIQNTAWQPDLANDLAEEECRERSEFSWLQDDRGARRECRRDLPRQHEEREVPRNDLADDADALAAGELGIEELRPARVVIEVARDERDVDV